MKQFQTWGLHSSGTGRRVIDWPMPDGAGLTFRRRKCPAKRKLFFGDFDP